MPMAGGAEGRWKQTVQSCVVSLFSFPSHGRCAREQGRGDEHGRSGLEARRRFASLAGPGGRKRSKGMGSVGMGKGGAASREGGEGVLPGKKLRGRGCRGRRGLAEALEKRTELGVARGREGGALQAGGDHTHRLVWQHSRQQVVGGLIPECVEKPRGEPQGNETSPGEGNPQVLGVICHGLTGANKLQRL